MHLFAFHRTRGFSIASIPRSREKCKIFLERNSASTIVSNTTRMSNLCGWLLPQDIICSMMHHLQRQSVNGCSTATAQCTTLMSRLQGCCYALPMYRSHWKKAGVDMTEDEVASMSTDTTGTTAFRLKYCNQLKLGPPSSRACTCDGVGSVSVKSSVDNYSCLPHCYRAHGSSEFI